MPHRAAPVSSIRHAAPCLQAFRWIAASPAARVLRNSSLGGRSRREVETISIPAAADGGMIGDATVQLDGELASALAVPDVGPVVLATGVVQEGEGFDDGAVGVGGEPREGEAVGSDAEPVSRAVDAVGVELILGKDVLGDGDRIKCHAFVE